MSFHRTRTVLLTIPMLAACMAFGKRPHRLPRQHLRRRPLLRLHPKQRQRQRLPRQRGALEESISAGQWMATTTGTTITRSTSSTSITTLMSGPIHSA